MSSGVLILILVVVLVAAAIVSVVLFTRRDVSAFKIDIGGQAPRADGGADPSPDKMLKARFTGLGIFSGGIIAALLARLWSMQIVNSDNYSEQAESNRTRTVTSFASRGRILDRNGVELVTNRPSLTVCAYSDVADDEVEITLLSNLLGLPVMAAKRRATDSTQSAQSARTVCIDVQRSTVAYIQEHADVFPQVTVEQRTQRSYPLGEVGCHLLGYTGTVTEDQIAAAEESSSGISYESGDVAGQAGIEYQYEEVLQGVRGEQTVYVDSNGNVTDYSTNVPAEQGSDIMLTIDSNVQKVAEESLKDFIKKRQDGGVSTCKSGAAVAVDVTNGEIIALASYPTFRPNVFVGGISQDDWDELSSEDAEYPLMNRAVAGQYVAASTIKPLTTFAALDNGVATKDSTYDCEGWWTGFGEADGKWCWNHTGHGGINLRNGITFSCDVVFYEIAKAFYNSDNNEAMQETFRKWGLGQTLGIDLPSEATGRVPDAEWKYNYFSSWSDSERQWNGGDNTNIAIGQGDILVTPLQMACVYMGLSNRGTIWTPHILKSVLGRGDNTTAKDYTPKEALKPEESSENFDLVQDALEGVIYEESESMTAHFTNMTERVAGKTGTGEHGDAEPTGWFCCYAPADNPKYAISAVVDNGGYGSVSAMYIARDILGALFNEPDDSTVEVTDGSR
jgi:penicillin-binding protein 2